MLKKKKEKAAKTEKDEAAEQRRKEYEVGLARTLRRAAEGKDDGPRIPGIHDYSRGE